MMKKFMKKLWEKKDSKKGFTLVELIVVLVILAILAAIMVPALLGWIDKAREKQLVVEGRTAYLAAQTLASEGYGLPTPSKAGVTEENVEKLAGLEDDSVVVGSIKYKVTTSTGAKDEYVVTGIAYKPSGSAKTATYADGVWTVAVITP